VQQQQQIYKLHFMLQIRVLQFSCYHLAIAVFRRPARKLHWIHLKTSD